MYSRFFPAVFLLLSVLFSVTAVNPIYAQSVDQEMRNLQEHYQKLNSLKFTFIQETSAGGRQRLGEGAAFFCRELNIKDKDALMAMRWDYLNPSVQTIVNTGKEIQIYTEEDKQLIISSAEQLDSDIVYAVFSGNMSISDAFTPEKTVVEETLTPGAEDIREIHLRPKQTNPQLQSLTLWYTSDFIIKKIKMQDQLGSVTTLSLDNIEINPFSHTDKQTLQQMLYINYPEGTEIIRQ